MRVVIVADVIAELDSLSARRLGKEQGRCLLGAVVRGDSAGVLVVDSVFVTAIWDPGERYADAASFDPRRPCPERVTVGRWHTHLPLKIVRVNGVIVEQGPVPERVACFLSDDDRRTALEGRRLLHVVQVSPRVRCAWLLLGGDFIPIPW